MQVYAVQARGEGISGIIGIFSNSDILDAVLREAHKHFHYPEVNISLKEYCVQDGLNVVYLVCHQVERFWGINFELLGVFSTDEEALQYSKEKSFKAEELIIEPVTLNEEI